MNEGRIQQIGTPREIYERPASQFVADFVGSTNFIEGTVLPCNGAVSGCHTVRTEIGDVTVRTAQELRAEERVALSVRPEDVELIEAQPEGHNVGQGRVDQVQGKPAGENVWLGRVDQKVFLGEAVDFQVSVGSRTLLSRRHPRLRTPVGHAIFVQVNPEKCVVLKVSS
jgi:iron(III) transport system ATP-binding protein